MTIAMENQAGVRWHKGVGITSFIIGVTSTICFLALLGAAGVLSNTGKFTEDLKLILGLGMMSAFLVDLIGIALGVFGAADRSSKKTYPVLGLTLNIGILVLFASLIAIGLTQGHN